MRVARRNLPARTFRPSAPPLRDSWPVYFFLLLTILAIVGWLKSGGFAPLLVSLSLLAAATWVSFRIRYVGSPTLEIDRDKVRYRCGRREEVAQWSDVEGVSFGPYERNELWIVRRSGPPIKFSSSMTSASGERFDMVFDDYLPPPKRAP